MTDGARPLHGVLNPSDEQHGRWPCAHASCRPTSDATNEAKLSWVFYPATQLAEEAWARPSALREKPSSLGCAWPSARSRELANSNVLADGTRLSSTLTMKPRWASCASPVPSCSLQTLSESLAQALLRASSSSASPSIGVRNTTLGIKPHQLSDQWGHAN